MMLIFDLDDTLVHTHRKAYEKTNAAAATLGKWISFGDFSAVYGKMDFDSCVKHWFDIDPVDFRERYEHLREQYPYEPIGDVHDLLSRLQNHTLGLITNSSYAGMNYKLQCARIDPKQFTFMYHKDNMIQPKPDAAQIHALISDGYTPESMIYVGDNVRDYRFACAGGIQFYAVLTGLERKEDFLQAGLQDEMILHNVQDLRQLY